MIPNLHEARIEPGSFTTTRDRIEYCIVWAAVVFGLTLSWGTCFFMLGASLLEGKQ